MKETSNREFLQNRRVTVMGLGLHGGGIASCRYAAEAGAQVTATDLRSAETLAAARQALADLPIRYVLGEHREEDFSGADMVIKNPAVPPDSPYLKAAEARGVPIETDLSLFLGEVRNPILAVTGSKGKSTTVSALHAGLARRWPGCRLGGNITVSPLTFMEELRPEDPVVLELSSWQLADLRGRGLLRPAVAAVTNIFPDHQDRYPSMEAYVADKQGIYADQGAGDWALVPGAGPWAESFRGGPPGGEIPLFPEGTFPGEGDLPEGQPMAWIEQGRGYFRSPGALDRVEELVPGETVLRGSHNRGNLLCAAVMMRLFGLGPEAVREAVGNFAGIAHRMEFLGERQGIRFYNDSAATIPDATAAALRSFSEPVVLIGGGTDKELDIHPWLETAERPKVWILLAGSATDRLIPHLQDRGVVFEGPCSSMAEAVERALGRADAGDAVLLSPGATSFGLFLNEFDRGNQFRELVRAIPGG